MSKDYKVGTWNIWCDEKTLGIRLPLVKREIANADVDIMCLQEVTQKALDYLLDSKLAETYFFSHGPSHLNISLNSSYDTVLLLRKEMFPKCDNKTKANELADTNHGRFLYTTDLGDFSVLGTHLESLLQKNDVRQKQINQIDEIDKMSLKPSVLLADTQMIDDGETFPQRWNDVWVEIESEKNVPDLKNEESEIEPGKAEVYTYDGLYNKNAKNLRSRTARILVTGDIKASNFTFFATDECDVDQELQSMLSKRSQSVLEEMRQAASEAAADEEAEIKSENSGVPVLKIDVSCPQTFIHPSDHFGVKCTISVPTLSGSRRGSASGRKIRESCSIL